MSKDNFCFIDEVFEQYRLGDATLKHQKAIEQAKQELRQGFKAAMLEEKEARIKQNKSFCGCPMCEHHSEPYEAQETLVNSKGEHKPHKRNGEDV